MTGLVIETLVILCCFQCRGKRVVRGCDSHTQLPWSPQGTIGTMTPNLATEYGKKKNGLHVYNISFPRKVRIEARKIML